MTAQIRTPGTKPQTLDVQIPDGPTVEIDISGQDVTPERINKLLENVKRQYAPTPFQQAYKAMGPPAAKVRDVATQGAARGLQTLGGIALEGVPMLEDLPFTQAGGQVAQTVAQRAVPQTPGQAASMAVLTMLSGPVGPMGGMASTGVGGALSRSILPQMAEQAVNYAVGDGVDPQQALLEFVVSLATEGAWGAIPKIKSRFLRTESIDKLGDDTARWLGAELDKVTSVKGLRTPEDFRHVMSGMGTDSPKPHETIFAREMSKTIDEAQKQIRGMLNPSMQQMSPVARERALSMLEEVADVKPTLIIPKGSPLSSEPSHRVYNNPPDVLFEKGMRRLRLKFQAANALEGAERFEAFEQYGAMRQQMEAALGAVSPMLAQQYDSMNRQFAVDYDILNFLWAMQKKGAWKSDSAGTHLNLDVTTKHLQDAGRLLDETGLFGGADKAIRHIAGPSSVPGARPTLHEGYARLFTSLPALPLAVSLARQPQLLTMPEGPVSSARARALSDWMMSQMVQYGMTPQASMGTPMLQEGVPMGGTP